MDIELLKEAKFKVDDLNVLDKQYNELLIETKKQRETLNTERKELEEKIEDVISDRRKDLSKSFDISIKDTEKKIKKENEKRNLAKKSGIKGRVLAETQGFRDEITAIKDVRKKEFKANKVPFFAQYKLYYTFFVTKGIVERVYSLMALLVIFILIPLGIYYIIPNHKIMHLVIIYVITAILFIGNYVFILNKTRVTHKEEIIRGRKWQDEIDVISHKIKKMIKKIKADKNEGMYHLEGYDKQIDSLNSEIDLYNQTKSSELKDFDSVVAISLRENYDKEHKEELDKKEKQVLESEIKIKDYETRINAIKLQLNTKYVPYIGKENMTNEMLEKLIDIIETKKADSVLEALDVIKKEEV